MGARKKKRPRAYLKFPRRLMFKEGTLDEELSEADRIDLANIEQITSFSLKYKAIKMKYGNDVAKSFRMPTML